MKVIVEKELEKHWGIEDFIEALGPEISKEDKEEALIEFLMEDICAILENAKWSFIE